MNVKTKISLYAGRKRNYWKIDVITNDETIWFGPYLYDTKWLAIESAQKIRRYMKKYTSYREFMEKA